jgi:plastocyanin
VTTRSTTSNNIRIIPQLQDFLDRKLGARGEVFYDQATNTLRLYDGVQTGGHKLARADLNNVTNAQFVAKAASAGVGGAGVNSFQNIVVAGQSSVIADSSADTLTLIAGSGITITTNAGNDSITITSTGSGGGDYTLPTASNTVLGGVRVDNSTIVINNGIISTVTKDFTFSVAADDSTLRTVGSEESIKFIGSGNISTSSDAEGNIVITGVAASTTVATLTDAALASLTVDKIYLPAITMLAVTNSGSTAYRFDQYGTTNNPTIYVMNGTTIAFNLQATGHPFLIQDSTGTNYNTGLIHVTTAGVVSTGSSAQGKDSGTLYWKIPDSISSFPNYRYQCSVHGGMVGAITIKSFAGI